MRGNSDLAGSLQVPIPPVLDLWTMSTDFNTTGKPIFFCSDKDIFQQGFGRN